MRTYWRQSEIEAQLVKLGLTVRQAKIGAAISLCEAPGGRYADGEFRARVLAIGDQELANSTWGYSYGLFQIRSLRSEKGTGGIRDEDRLLDPVFNCTSAVAIRRAWGGSWRAWATYTSGAYKAYLQDLYPPPPNTYVVVSGDTLGSIALKLSGGQWTWQDLAMLNNLHSPYTIYINQHLILPLI